MLELGEQFRREPDILGEHNHLGCAINGSNPVNIVEDNLARISHEQEYIREKLAEGASVSRMDSQSWQERHTNTAVARNCLEVVKERVTRTGPV